jgi:hypothetical protein
MMKVLITGGSGLIGRALTASLIADGHEVIILSRDPEKSKRALPGVQLVKWDGKTSEGWGHLVEDTGAIVNLAGENLSAGLWTDARKQRILNSRLNAGRAVLQAIDNANHKPSVLIQASGVGYYGVQNPDLLDESAPRGSDFLADVSRDWEAVTKPVEEMGVRRVILRSGVVSSQPGGPPGLMLLPFRFYVGGPLGSGTQWLSLIHIEDEVRAILFLIENKSASGVFNLSAKAVTNAEFSKAAGKALRKPSFIRVPRFLLKLVLGEMSTMVLDGQRAAATKLTESGFKFKYEQIEDALKSLV